MPSMKQTWKSLWRLSSNKPTISDVMIVLWQINRLSLRKFPQGWWSMLGISPKPHLYCTNIRQLWKILWVVQECDVSRLWWFMSAKSANAYRVHCVYSTGNKLYLHFIVIIHLLLLKEDKCEQFSTMSLINSVSKCPWNHCRWY